MNLYSLSSEKINYLISLFNQGKLVEVVEKTNILLNDFPNEFILWNLIGAANSRLKKFSEAEFGFEKAIQLNPHDPNVYNNLGALLHEQLKYEQSIINYEKALNIKSDSAEIYYNLGRVYSDLGKLDESVKLYKQAISIKHDYVLAYNNMGKVLYEQGKIKQSLDSYIKAISINPDYDMAYYNIGFALTGITFTTNQPFLQNIIIQLLDKKNVVKPTNVFPSAISLLKHDPIIKKIFKKYSSGTLNQPIEKIISELSKVPLLLKLMQTCELPDIEFENVLIAIRSSVLLNISKFKNNNEILLFQVSLATQCFINEYIYNKSKIEVGAIKRLERSIGEKLDNGVQVNSLELACLASYKPLHKYSWKDLIIPAENISKLIGMQVFEPKEEEKLISSIPLLQKIKNNISSKVQTQYEENPYPRWVNIGLPIVSLTISKFIETQKLNLFDNRIKDCLAPHILIAGCGTGQHSISTASTFKDSNVLAIDLSARSLSYAKRKTIGLGLTNIKYIQADILNLNKLNKKFDLIESVGVVHHMDKPIEGWKVLVNCLHHGGLMNIGLYSELARKDIVKIRNEILELGLKNNEADMRAFRNKIINSKMEHHNNIKQNYDFFTLSTFRDLLFNVQEHRFTILDIQKHLSELGLKFCGFQNEKIIKKFQHLYSGNNNPQTFMGMYQFWCQKVRL